MKILIEGLIGGVVAAAIILAPPAQATCPDPSVIDGPLIGAIPDLPVTPGDDIASAGALPQKFLPNFYNYLELEEPLPNEIGPAVRSPLEDPPC